MRTKYRLGIDAGGTFTDFVLADNTGDARLYKALSTPDDPTRAIENGLRLLSEDIGARPRLSPAATSASTAPPSGSMH